MNDHEVIAILVGVLALLAGGLGYGLGEQRRHRDESKTYIQQIEEHERRLRAHRALIEVIAEDYDPPDEPQQSGQRRRKLPEGWSVINGGSVLAGLVVLGDWIRRHWRGITATAAASTGAAVLGVALLGHGAPPGRHQAGPQPSAPHASGTARAKRPAPSTKPSHGPPGRTLAPTPLLPVRRRTPASPASPLASAPAPQPSPPPPRPSPSRSPSPPRPTPTPTNTCPAGVAVHVANIGIVICV